MPVAVTMRISDRFRLPKRPWPRLLVCGLALVLLTLATRLPLLRLNRPIDDEVVYGVVAQTIVDGGVPYVSAVERKPPLLFYVYAAVLRTFGSYNWRALHLVEIVWILATMGGLYVVGRRLFDADTGLIAALLYSIFQAWSYWNNLAFNGEVLMNLPIVWAYALGFSEQDSRRSFNLFIAGGLLAVGFLLKQPAAIAFVPLALHAVSSPQRRTGLSTLNDSLGRLSSLSIGFATALVAAAVWLFSRGLLGDAFYWTITNHAVPQVYWDKGIENTLAFTAFCLPITAGAWLSSRDSELWKEKRSERNALIALVVVSLLGAASSGRFYPHYFIAVIPPCALLAAPWFGRVWRARGRERRIGHLTQAWLTATVVVFVVAHGRGLMRQPAVSEAGQYLLAHSSEQDRIFVWGQTTRIYVDAHRRPASRYIATFPLTGLIFGAPHPAAGEPPANTRGRIVPGAWDNLRKDFAQHEPAYIVDTEAAQGASYPVSDFPALAKLLSEEYEPVAQTTDGVIYKRDTSKRAQLAALRWP
jgi:4-amino-4-deoxy-L-arabinose transferase-like glycosyltransferase